MLWLKILLKISLWITLATMYIILAYKTHKSIEQLPKTVHAYRSHIDLHKIFKELLIISKYGFIIAAIAALLSVLSSFL